MRHIILFFVLGFFLTSCTKAPTDTKIRRQVVGTWQPTSSAAGGNTTVVEMRPDGSFTTRWSSAGKDHELGGAWNVQGGFLVLTGTNAVGKTVVERQKIVRINKSEMVCQMDGRTNLTKVLTRK